MKSTWQHMPVVDGLTQSHTIIMVDHRDSEEYTLRHEEYSVQHGTVLSAWPRLSRQMLHRAGCKQNHGADVDSLGRCVTVATSRSTPCSKPTTDSQHIQRDVSTTSAVVVSECVCVVHTVPPVNVPVTDTSYSSNDAAAHTCVWQATVDYKPQLKKNAVSDCALAQHCT